MNLSKIGEKIFEYYVYACVIWVHIALGIEIYFIIKHFEEFGFQ
jgi:hypothetical protein